MIYGTILFLLCKLSCQLSHSSKLRHVMTPTSTMTHNNLSSNYFEITCETRLRTLSVYRHMLLHQCVFVVSGVDSEVSYILCGSHETG